MQLPPSESKTQSALGPPTDLKTVVESEVKEWHFHIYFLQNNEEQHAEALALRDAVLRLRRDGAFVAVPLWRVNTEPIGPHPAGSYEIWCPSETFASLYSYLCQHHGNLSILIHPLTREHRKDHDSRAAWIGKPWPVDLSKLPVYTVHIPLQYSSLKLGYSSEAQGPSLEERKKNGSLLESKLENEDEAAKAPKQ
ncbi:hypothetical protein M422DRAFT_234442 [Sphaerobolus stellatus SS14]|uniref:DOPA 4,5-dioxygenase n=1 Tax=Sphaerobolus stellatus (strain SS14) TaxID=990650 RepID=A0A0C9URG4_SPHS4|nr:hypothetical protein M422DRAFT_234442 [Sphaerobolus stellatus SS14]